MNAFGDASSQSTNGDQTPRHYSRRHFLALSAALGATMFPATGHASPLIIPTPTPAVNNTYTGDDRGLTVTWDSDLWQVKYEPVAGTDGITLVDTDVDVDDVHADKYYVQIGYVPKEHWTTVDAVQQNAIDDWFNLGMLNATIVQEWMTQDAYGFFYTSYVQNTQALYYMEYSAVDPANAIWRWITTAIDSAIYDATRTETLFAGVTVDAEQIPRAVDAGALIALFDQYVAK